jgi:farnesol dehydrogenase
MTDLVTGATGFVGQHLVDALVARGQEVRCLVRDAMRGAALSRPGVEVRVGELTDARFVEGAVEGVRDVYHLAGGGRVTTASEEDLRRLRVANVDTLAVLLQVVRGHPVRRVVHFSSAAAMGLQLDIRLDEDSPCLPRTPYEVAKYDAEQIAARAFVDHLTPIVVLRPPQIYGPGDVRSELPMLMRLARRGLVPLFGYGRGRVPWVYVSDVVDAALLAAASPRAPGRTYIVSDRDSYAFADVIAAIASELGRRRGGIPIPREVAAAGIAMVERVWRAAGREPPFTRYRLNSVCSSRLLSIERARAELGFEPRVGLREGMHETVAWFRREGLI